MPGQDQLAVEMLKKVMELDLTNEFRYKLAVLVGQIDGQPIMESEPELYVADELDCILDGRFIDAIKAIRNRTGLGLKQARDYADKGQAMLKVRGEFTGELNPRAAELVPGLRRKKLNFI